MINICCGHITSDAISPGFTTLLELLNLSNTIKMFSKSCQIYAKHVGMHTQVWDLSHKDFIVDFSSKKNGCYISHPWLCFFFFFYQYFYIILCTVQLHYFRICSIPLILIIACFLCCLQWPFSGGIGKKRQEREKERKENSIAEDQEKA